MRSDGTTQLLLSPLELIEKLATLVPPPRLNLLRHHGLLAPNARHRSQVGVPPNSCSTLDVSISSPAMEEYS